MMRKYLSGDLSGEAMYGDVLSRWSKWARAYVARSREYLRVRRRVSWPWKVTGW